jgi:1-deoxy-D-xylulose 5-phosphate reductoisomerase
MSAIVGAAGLEATLAAVRRGAVVALANKETRVCAGDNIVCLFGNRLRNFAAEAANFFFGFVAAH